MKTKETDLEEEIGSQVVHDKFFGNGSLRIEEFDYYLPENLIAQSPVEPRDRSRLMVLFRDKGIIEHSIFKDIEKYINPGDCLVLNDTRVLPARIYGRRKDTGGRVEILLVERLSDGIDTKAASKRPGGGYVSERWSVLAKPARRARPGSYIVFGEDHGLEGMIVSAGERGERVIEFFEDYDELGPNGNSDIHRKILSLGKVPLPPYIKKSLDRPERYQTVFASELGSVAAPTAGLHFTQELLRKLDSSGVRLAYLTLHVGPGTFRPIETDNITEHVMHEERFSISKLACETINATKSCGGRVLAVGTTSVRVLEACSSQNGRIQPATGRTNLFIYPPYEFRIVDGMITNFHLPRSTLLCLVSAFAGRDLCRKAYEIAIQEQYRFYSFGDAMMIL